MERHVQLPNGMGGSKLEIKDQLVYLVIKSHNNPEDGCFPSLECIAGESGLSIPTVRGSIDRLRDEDYIRVVRDGRRNCYEFNPHKGFEPFSEDFLKRKDLTPTTKAYLVAIQQYMYKDVEGVGKMSMSNREIARSINTSEFTVRKCNSELSRHNFMTIVRDFDRDLETGCFRETKVFRLAELGQAVIWKLREHDDAINDHTVRIDSLERTVESQKRLIEKLLQERERDNAEFKV